MKRMESFPSDYNGLEQALDFIRQFLKEYKIRGKEYLRAQLTAEEGIATLLDHAEKGSAFLVRIKAFLGNVRVEISSKGEEYELAGDMKVTASALENDAGATVQETVRNILLKAYTSDLKYHHRAGKNTIRMTVYRSRNAFLYETMGAMLLAVIAGLLLSQIGSAQFNQGLDSNFLTPVKTMYMNALKMIVAPVVFFSIISCIVQFSSLTELGRIGGKVAALYAVTTVIAVCVGIGAFFLFQPGTVGNVGKLADATAITSQKMDISFRDMIVGIVPSNILQPFLESNMLQLIFLAILLGIAVGLIGKYSEVLRGLIDAFNDLFLKVTALIIRFMPIAAFCSILSMMLSMGVDTLLSVLGTLGTFLFGLVCMMAVYCLMLLLGRLNPVPFIKKYSPTMLQVFSMASSNAAIPLNMEACEKRLGIAQKVYSLSIPLGATLNMNGTCIHLAVFSLALARIYGVHINAASLLSLALTIMVLSVGAPGIPGSGLICLSVLLTQIGVPVEAVGLVMGIDTLVGMFRCMSNCLGDVVVTVIVAKSEKLLDIKKYRS